jgi:hypothetical protein
MQKLYGDPKKQIFRAAGKEGLSKIRGKRSVPYYCVQRWNSKTSICDKRLDSFAPCYSQSFYWSTGGYLKKTSKYSGQEFHSPYLCEWKTNLLGEKKTEQKWHLMHLARDELYLHTWQFNYCAGLRI